MLDHSILHLNLLIVIANKKDKNEYTNTTHTG